LVLPSELLHAKYAGPVRDFIRSRFSRVSIVTFEERPFPGVLTDIVLLLAEGDGPSPNLRTIPVRSATDLASLPALDVAAGWNFEMSSEKWSAALLPADGLRAYRTLVSEGPFNGLSEWGKPYLGAVSGNNRYFGLSAAEVSRLELPASDVLRVVPPGSRHLRGLEFSEAAYESAMQNGEKVFLFRPQTPMSDAATAYIDDGERAGVSTAYKCRVRSPWYQVPLVQAPDVFLTYMSHKAPRLVTNSAGVHILNSVHGVQLRSHVKAIGRELLPVAALNTATLLGAELVGRSYGGGVLKLEPREADDLPLPSQAILEAARDELLDLVPRLARPLRSGDIEAASKVVDEVLLVRTMQFSRGDVRSLRKALTSMRDRRATRARK